MNPLMDLKNIRKQLAAQRQTLNEQISAEEAKLVPQTTQNPDRSSLAMEYATHERDLALYEKNHDHLAQIDAALERMDAGTYGICENCGKEIHPARLEALPYATLCINCQTKQEMS